MIRITSKIQPFYPFTFSDISWKFHQNPSISFWAILYTNTSGRLDPDDPDSDPDHSQNLITCSSSQYGHFLKISSKCTHKFLSYLSLKIKFHGSRRSRQLSESLPKFNQIFLLPFWTYPENFIKIHLSVFELSCSQTNKQIEGQKWPLVRYFGGQWMTLNEDL